MTFIPASGPRVSTFPFSMTRAPTLTLTIFLPYPKGTRSGSAPISRTRQSGIDSFSFLRHIFFFRPAAVFCLLAQISHCFFFRKLQSRRKRKKKKTTMNATLCRSSRPRAIGGPRHDRGEKKHPFPSSPSGRFDSLSAASHTEEYTSDHNPIRRLLQPEAREYTVLSVFVVPLFPRLLLL